MIKARRTKIKTGEKGKYGGNRIRLRYMGSKMRKKKILKINSK